MLLLTLSASAVAAAPADAAGLDAGVGRADITPPTGYAFGGWSRADREGQGVHTRLQASALVLRRGRTKVALVSAALRLTSGGTLREVADRVRDLGLDETTIFVSATHTHAGPAPIAAFPSFNGLAPSPETLDRPQTATDFFVGSSPADPALYRFLAERIAVAIRRADAHLGPAEAGWGQTSLTGVTKNRSLEAHLADHGVLEDRGEGRVEQDPAGAEHTIDPAVRVLRVDRLGPRRRDGRRRTRIPLGAWASFANHGTVNPPEFEVYNADHHAAATAVLEAGIRRLGRVKPGRRVVAVYGNGNEGDLSAGLGDRGPLVAERVGVAEGEAMLRAWRTAGRAMRRSPALASRWTRVCFCGQMTAAGPVAQAPASGVPFLTGSEEGRGPLFDLTGVPLEGVTQPGEPDPQQGRKLVFDRGDETTYPKAVPLAVLRIGDRAILTLPGEATVETGRRARAAVLDGLGGTVRDAVVSGLTNEHVQYLTTPEEYDRQHYEGGSTTYGPAAGTFLTEQLGGLARALRAGAPAAEPYAFDPRNGLVAADGPAYPSGAEAGRVLREPAARVAPGSQVAFTWRGGAGGFDRPLDTPFVSVVGDDGGRVADDLGLAMVWTVDADGVHRATWQVPRDLAPRRGLRFVVTAKGYELRSRTFAVDAGAPATPVAPGTPADDPAARYAPFTAR